MNTEITDLSDIKKLVDLFYSKVKKDEMLAPIFTKVIQNNWSEHLEKMYTFWQTLLLKEHTYHGSPFLPHAHLPVEKKHFDRWLFLFNETLDENFTGEIAKEAKWRANKMAEMFQLKIEYHYKNDSKPLL